MTPDGCGVPNVNAARRFLVINVRQVGLIMVLFPQWVPCTDGVILLSIPPEQVRSHGSFAHLSHWGCSTLSVHGRSVAPFSTSARTPIPQQQILFWTSCASDIIELYGEFFRSLNPNSDVASML